MWMAITRCCKRRFMRLCIAVVSAALSMPAQATIRLDTWQSYGGMAEQGAICAAFARLMELQSLVDPRTGKLWQERHRYAGSVIAEAARLEEIAPLTSDDMRSLVDRYAAWLMTNLTETSYGTMINGDAHAAATKMIGDVCRQIYKSADQSIVKNHPELANCAVAGNCVATKSPAPQTNSANTTHQKSDLKKLLRQNLALQQRIDILEAAAAASQQTPPKTIFPAKMSPAENAPRPAAAEKMATPPAYMADAPVTSDIGMNGLDVAFAVTPQPTKSGYIVHIGSYLDETTAHQAQYQLQKLDSAAIADASFDVVHRHHKNGTRFDVVSAPLSPHHVTQLCAVLWRQKFGCDATFTP
jgi:hypothetical protein